MPFLRNNHHNLFEGKPITYNNFVCKDCTQNMSMKGVMDPLQKPYRILDILNYPWENSPSISRHLKWWPPLDLISKQTKSTFNLQMFAPILK